MIKKYKDDYNLFKKDQMGYSRELDIQMVDMLNNMVSAKGSSVLSLYNPTFKKGDLNIYKMLERRS